MIRFSFAFDIGASNIINPSMDLDGIRHQTRFNNVTRNEAWVPVLNGKKSVIFTAPTGSRIDPGDRFFVTVQFDCAVNSRGFS